MLAHQKRSVRLLLATWFRRIEQRSKKLDDAVVSMLFLPIPFCVVMLVLPSSPIGETATEYPSNGGAEHGVLGDDILHATGAGSLCSCDKCLHALEPPRIFFANLSIA